MTLESLVPSREMCGALKKAGFRQDTAFVWDTWARGGERGWCVVQPMEWADPMVAAPTLQEVLGELRALGRAPVEISVSKYRESRATRYDFPETSTYAKSPVEAAAQLWLRVKEESRG